MKKDDFVYLRHIRDAMNNYFGVDLDAIWDTVEKDIPSLKSAIKNIIEKEEKL
jgi:uncharacterized protein with HEPN domain